MLIYFDNYNYRALHSFCGYINRQPEQVIPKTMYCFRTRRIGIDNTHPTNPLIVRTEEVIADVKRCDEENPNETIAYRAIEAVYFVENFMQRF